MLNLRIVRGPLEVGEYETILKQYNRMTSAQIPLEEFIHWVRNGPAGPAWHAFLETEEDGIVGHTSLIPFRVHWNGTEIVPAKSEYSFLREEFRTTKIRGFENSNRPPWQIFSDQFFRHCNAIGWGPLWLTTAPVLMRWGPSNKFYPTNIPLWECLLVLEPWSAAWKTPNLSRGQRILLCLVGVFQRIGWSLFSLVSPCPMGIRSIPISDGPSPECNGSLSFFEDRESLQWRYLPGQYERLALDPEGREYVIVKKGSSDRYLRVCQWRLDPDRPIRPLVTKLVQMAREENALGVRWAVYGDDERAANLACRMSWLGFLSARRVRTLLVSAKEQDFLSSKKWKLTDAMFSFDP